MPDAPPETLAATPAAPFVAPPVAPEVLHEAPEAPPVCASCGTVRVGPFCHACGEKKLDRHDYAFLHFAEHTLDTFTHLDVKVFKSIWSLVARPGAMAADLLAGRRVAWAKPFQTFLIANLIFYLGVLALGVSFFDAGLYIQLINPYSRLLAPLAKAKAAALGQTMEVYTETYNHLSHTLSKTLVVLMVPIVAILLTLLFWRKRRYFLEHVTVAALAVSQFMLLSLIVILAATLVSRLLQIGEVGQYILIPLLMASNAVLFILTFRRVYPSGWGITIAKGMALTFLVMASVVYVFRPLLFLITNAFT